MGAPSTSPQDTCSLRLPVFTLQRRGGTGCLSALLFVCVCLLISRKPAGSWHHRPPAICVTSVTHTHQRHRHLLLLHRPRPTPSRRVFIWESMYHSGGGERASVPALRFWQRGAGPIGTCKIEKRRVARSFARVHKFGTVNVCSHTHTGSVP